MRLILLTFFVLSSFIFAKEEVTVSILPQKYFVEKIAADKVKVNVMVQPGASPATYEPKTSQMKLLSKSVAYFSIGVPFEKVWLEKFENANKDMLIADTSKGIKKAEIAAHHHHKEEADEHEDEHHEEHADHDEEEHEHHEHHEEEEHAGYEHHGLDPHIWLEPTLVKIQAKNIYEALVKVDKTNASFYKTNLDKFLKELDSLDEELHNILKNYENKAFMVFHPSWGYFSRRYHLEQISIEIEGKEPKPAQLVKLVDEAKKHNIKIVFVAPQFSQKGAKTISKSINGNVAVIDPLAENWDENLIKVAKEIAKSYK
ncbi:metal ABC transporter solute-binding protein, Zn/Mn family [Halarcobacter anaerophilus]|jgi:zinc transport system substrate-binding protein|uniref:metal ABC transporter solute-binding protein, Zn/Mn family n=1 Tax=Halarcobacter anaerophilus TaxID=877500 RepID=UPI0005CAA892|nr:zinc ABC transporter substrate-binding protein [Halarcobacter anaerophilus]